MLERLRHYLVVVRTPHSILCEVLPLYKDALYQTALDLLAVVEGRWEREEQRALAKIQEHSDLNCRLTAIASVRCATEER